MRRRFDKSAVKYFSLTERVPLILSGLNMVAVGGMCGVAVKCLDITQNIDCEGSSQSHY